MVYLSDHIYYKKNSLWVENVEISTIKIKTPYYCYSYQGIVDNYQKISHFMPSISICYAVKANPNISIIKTLVDQGAGVDVVSEGEIRRALIAGAKKIIFSGVGKTKQEIEFALKNNVYQINVESISELKLVKQITSNIGVTVPIGVRVNLDVDGETHDKISTCRKQDKFGIGITELDQFVHDNEIVSFSIHIGSQISNLTVFKNTFYKLKNILEKFKHVKRLDLGGGFFVPYRKGEYELKYLQYYEFVQNLFKGYEIIIEPGRVLLGNTGVLISQVLYIKRDKDNTHVIIDSGMNDLMRVALYEAHHEIIPINNQFNTTEIVDIVGPICESGDIFARQRKISTLVEGDLIAICTAGAYGSSMSNNYNSRLLVPEIMVKDNEYFIIRNKETYDELIDRELRTSFYSFNYY